MRDSVDILVPDGYRKLTIGGKVIAKVDLGNEAGPELFRLTISKLEDDRFWAEPSRDDPVGGIGGRWFKYDDFGKEWNLCVPKVKHRRPCNECKGMIEEGSERDVCEFCQSKLVAKLQNVAAQMKTRHARVSSLLCDQRRIGTLERYFGEYGRACESKGTIPTPVAGSFSHAKRLADEHEQHRISACCAMFIAVLTDLGSKLEATL